MAALDTYSQYIQSLLEKYSQPAKTDPTVETQLVFDTLHHHY